MKSNLDKLFKTDKGLEKSGVWFNLTEETGFLVKPFKGSNPQIKAAFAAYYKPYARQIEIGSLESEKEQEILVKVFVHSCLIDWKGVVIDDKPTPFAKDVAIEFLKELPELFDSLMTHAQDYRNYKEEFPGVGGEELGNS